jgi:biopolymer transport protein TolR
MSHSARSKRMARHHERSRKGASLNLVSLMDIFTILVFFLLVNSAEVQTLEPPKSVTLPESMALEKPRDTVVVMVTTDQVLVQGTPVVSVADIDAADGVLIAPLRDALKAQPYRVLKKVMATCTDADYGKLSLAVLQKEEAMAAQAAGA